MAAVGPSSSVAEGDQLREKIRGLEDQLSRALLRSQKLETQLQHAQAQVAWFHRMLFGQKAERVDRDAVELGWREFLEEQERTARGLPTNEPTPAGAAKSLQLLLLLGGTPDAVQDARSALASAGIPADPGTAPMSASPPPSPPPKKRDAHGRKQIPENLRLERVLLAPDLGEFADDARYVDTEVSYRIGIRPAEIYAIAIERPRYAVALINGKSKSVVADPPAEMIERGLLAPSALAHVLALKWERHVPWSRTALYFAGQGYELSKSTLAGASVRAEPLAKSLVDAMITHGKTVAPYLAIDATGARLQGKERCTNGHTWMRFVDGVGVFVSFTAKHDAVAANAQLDGWDCPFLADGAAVFNDFERRSRGRFGCMSHCRRKFFFAFAAEPQASVGIRLTNTLFEIERALVAAPPEIRLAERRARSGPVFQELVRWCRQIEADPKVSPRSLLGKAVRYALNQEHRLRRFLDDGRVPIHNNLTELQIRHFAVGRKNWLFYGSEAAASAGSTWLTLVLSAKMHGLQVESYFRELFRVLPQWPKSRLLELAPHNWAGTRARLDPTQLAAEFGAVTIPPKLA